MNEDWRSASLFLKKAQVLGEMNEESLFMLIRSEVFSGDLSMAQEDCRKFIADYPKSVYLPYVSYQNGKLLHELGRNEESVDAFVEFCRDNPDHELFANAIYFMAESFFDEYNFASAKSLYLKVVCDFPQNANAQDSKHKIELIENREREEKLLYLLKAVGEESLSAREEYERRFKIDTAEDRFALERQLYQARARIAELESQRDEAAKERAAVEEPKKEASPEKEIAAEQTYDASVDVLKLKAKYLKYLLEVLDSEEGGDYENDNKDGGEGE